MRDLVLGFEVSVRVMSCCCEAGKVFVGGERYWLVECEEGRRLIYRVFGVVAFIVI